jgi:hypothetical protein
MQRHVMLFLNLIFAPVLLQAQGLSVAQVIPTSPLVSRGTSFIRPAPARAAVKADTTVRACNMPIATAGTPTPRGAREGGISVPYNAAVPILTTRSACRTGSQSADASPDSSQRRPF